MEEAHGAGGEEGGAPSGAEEPLSLAGDRGALALLLLLYTLQGVPMGLATSVSFLLQERGASMADQAAFSFVSWPFSLKILWAPLVDTFFLPALGQRRTWLLPVQALVGALMLALGGTVDALLRPADGGGPAVPALTRLFFALYFLMATQDVAVDGWALTLLSRRNVGLASTVNAVGQSAGFFLAYTGYMFLSERGLVTLPGFMRFWGLTFLASVLAVGCTREAPADGGAVGVADVYRQLGRLLRLRAVRTLLAVLLTCRLAFGATDALTQLSLMGRAGLSKTQLAYLNTAVAPLPMLLPLLPLVARLTSGDAPWSTFLAAYPMRLAVGLATAAVVAAAPPPGLPRGGFFAAAFAVLAARELLSQLQFVAQMAFFARVSDPAIGGTAMTLLNTVANLGAKWPSALVLYAADGLTRRTCVGAEGGCADAGARASCAANGGVCVTQADGLTPLTVACTLAGVAWLALARRRVRVMEALPPAAWIASKA